MNNNPSLDPANNGSLAGTIQFAMKKIMQQIDTMLPARVIAFDRDENRVRVEILISVVTTDGSQLARPQLQSLPVLVLGGGGFMINFPIQPNDLGWVLANDRDISLFLESYSQSPPNTARMKNFSDALFIPDVMRDFDISSGDASKMVIQSVDGLTKISVSETEIDIVAPVQVQVTTPLFHVIGNITATGTITPGA